MHSNCRGPCSAVTLRGRLSTTGVLSHTLRTCRSPRRERAWNPAKFPEAGPPGPCGAQHTLLTLQLGTQGMHAAGICYWKRYLSFHSLSADESCKRTYPMSGAQGLPRAAGTPPPRSPEHSLSSGSWVGAAPSLRLGETRCTSKWEKVWPGPRSHSRS